MLSADLRSLAAWFYEFKESGLLLDSDGVDYIARLLVQHSQEAMTMEGHAPASRPAVRPITPYGAAVRRQNFAVFEGGLK